MKTPLLLRRRFTLSWLFLLLLLVIAPASVLLLHAQGVVELPVKTDASGNPVTPLKVGVGNLPNESLANWDQVFADSIDGLLAGKTASTTTEEIYLAGTDTRNTGAWFASAVQSLTCISSSSSTSVPGPGWHVTLLSPHYGLCAYHITQAANSATATWLGVGNTVTYTNVNNVAFTLTITALTRVGSTDLCIVTFGAAVDASISPATVLPATLPGGFTFVGDPVIYANQLGNLNVGEVVSIAASGDVIQSATASQRTAWTTSYSGYPAQSGDSSSPIGFLEGGQFVLLSCFHNPTGNGEDVGLNAVAVNAVLSANGESLKVAHLPGYPMTSYAAGTGISISGAPPNLTINSTAAPGGVTTAGNNAFTGSNSYSGITQLNGNTYLASGVSVQGATSSGGFEILGGTGGLNFGGAAFNNPPYKFTVDASGNEVAPDITLTAIPFSSHITSPVQGAVQTFSDSITQVPGAVITGGGSFTVLGFYTGSAWIVAAGAGSGTPAATITGTASMPLESTYGVPQKIVMSTVVTDSAGWWNATSTRYIPQRAGRYVVTAYFVGTASGSGDFWDLCIALNGQTQWNNRLPSSTVYGPDMVATAQIIVNGSTDYIELWGGQGHGGAISGSERLEIVYAGPN